MKQPDSTTQIGTNLPSPQEPDLILVSPPVPGSRLWPCHQGKYSLALSVKIGSHPKKKVSSAKLWHRDKMTQIKVLTVAEMNKRPQLLTVAQIVTQIVSWKDFKNMTSKN